MRKTTLWMLAASAAVAVACVAGGAAAQDAPAKPAAPAVSADTLIDVEVMRVVLVREGLSPITPSNPQQEYGVAWIAAGPSSSEAFVVAGDGATFVLRTSDPVAPSAAEPKSGEPAPEPSAWDQAEAELAGKPRMVRTRVTFDRYDAAKVEALRGRILEQLAKYGHKVRGLGPDSHLTVVVVGARRNANFVAVTPGTTSVFDETGRIVEKTGDAARAALLALNAYNKAGGGASTVLTIRVTVADCQASAQGRMDIATFRHRAVISAY